MRGDRPMYHVNSNRLFVFTRMRGDRPYSGAWEIGPGRFTPHARGSTRGLRNSEEAPKVYPACAGIDLV